MTSDLLHSRTTSGAAAGPADAEHPGGTRFAFLAETSRCLSDSLDLEIVAPDESISRVAVIHPDAAKQKLARDFFRERPWRRDDPIGAPRVIRTNHSEFALVERAALLDEIDDLDQRDVLRQLGAQSFLIVAMRARGRTLGAITFVSDDQRPYNDADLLLAEDLGRRCVDTARLYPPHRQCQRQPPPLD